MEKENKICYAAVQNGCILDVFDDKLKAEVRINEEIKRDWLQIMLKKRLRKAFQKSGDISLHQYSIMTIVNVEAIK